MMVDINKYFDIIKKFFHKCTYGEPVITHSNSKGCIWIQECKCGKNIEVLFDANGKCVDVKNLTK
jgi:hypothetical protein